MFNKMFCEIKGKKVIQWGGAWGNGGIVQIASWKYNFGIYLDIQAITTLLCLLLILYLLVSSIHSFFYLTTTLRKSEVFRHSKAYSSHSFQPTGIVLSSLWRENRSVLPIISAFLEIGYFFFFKVAYFAQKKTGISKNSLKFINIFFSKSHNWVHVYMY